MTPEPPPFTTYCCMNEPETVCSVSISTTESTVFAAASVIERFFSLLLVLTAASGSVVGSDLVAAAFVCVCFVLSGSTVVISDCFDVSDGVTFDDLLYISPTTRATSVNIIVSATHTPIIAAIFPPFLFLGAGC